MTLERIITSALIGPLVHVPRLQALCNLCYRLSFLRRLCLLHGHAACERDTRFFLGAISRSQYHLIERRLFDHPLTSPEATRHSTQSRRYYDRAVWMKCKSRETLAATKESLRRLNRRRHRPKTPSSLNSLLSLVSAGAVVAPSAVLLYVSISHARVCL